MKFRFPRILKFIVSFMLIMTLILPNFIYSISIAEGEVTSVERFVGNTVNIGGKDYILSQSEFMLNYEIKNGTDRNIEQIIVNETLTDNNGQVREVNTPISDSNIETGGERTFQGGKFQAKEGAGTYTLKYTVQYVLEGESEHKTISSGSKQISILSTGVSVTYRASAGKPITPGGEVKYTFDIKSAANIDIENIRVRDSVLGEIGVIANLEPGATSSISKSFTLNKTTKSYPIIVFDDPTGSQESIERAFKNASVEVVVEEKKEEEKPVEKPLELSGKVNKSKISSNEEVDFSLSLINKGNKALTNVKLVDWAGREIFSKDSLAPGKEGTVIYSARVEPSTNYTFKATATEQGTGRNVQASYVAKFTGIEAKLEIINRVTAEDIAVGDTVTIEYTLKNTGKATMVDILVQEPEFGEVARFDKLQSGQEETFAVEKIIEEDSISHPRVYAKEENSGQDYEFQGDPIEIAINAIESNPLLTIKLTSEPKMIAEEGMVDLICTVKNEGDIRIDNIELVLNERDVNIGSILTLEPGAEETLTLSGVDIREDTSFTATAKGITYDGQNVEFSSEAYEVKIGVDESDEQKENPKLSFLKKLLGVVISLAVATAGGIVYLIIDLKRGGKNKIGKKKKIRIRRKKK